MCSSPSLPDFNKLHHLIPRYSRPTIHSWFFPLPNSPQPNSAELDGWASKIKSHIHFWPISLMWPDSCLVSLFPFRTPSPTSGLHISGRRIFQKHKSYHVTSQLRTFQWFPIPLIIKFKFLNVAYKAIYPLATIYCAIPLTCYSPLLHLPFCLLNVPNDFLLESNCDLNLRFVYL